jgi:hypothetical protein
MKAALLLALHHILSFALSSHLFEFLLIHLDLPVIEYSRDPARTSLRSNIDAALTTDYQT